MSKTWYIEREAEDGEYSNNEKTYTATEYVENDVRYDFETTVADIIFPKGKKYNDPTFCVSGEITDAETNFKVNTVDELLEAGKITIETTDTKANIQTLGAELAATEKEKYLYAGCKNKSQMENLGFKTDGLTSFVQPLYSLDTQIDSGTGLFENCTTLTAFSADIPVLSNGTNLFKGCTSLTSFSSLAFTLNNGTDMFTDCTSLTLVEFKKITSDSVMQKVIASLPQYDTPSEVEHVIKFNTGDNDKNTELASAATTKGWTAQIVES